MIEQPSSITPRMPNGCGNPAKTNGCWDGSTAMKGSITDDNNIDYKSDTNNQQHIYQNGGGNVKTTTTPSLEALSPSSTSSSSLTDCSPMSSSWSIRGRASQGGLAVPSQQSHGQRQGRRQGQKRSGVSCVWWLDVPLLILVMSWVGMSWMMHVYSTYWDGLFQTMVASTSNPRDKNDWTYYRRDCETAAVSTADASQLYLPTISELSTTGSEGGGAATAAAAAAAPDYYIRHHLKHGFSMVRNALSAETAHALRQYILERNQVTGKEYFVLKNKNRYSFGLDNNHHPILAKALEELTRPEGQLSQVLEQVMGPDPALIELTAITSEYGAKDQHFHSDVVGSLSSPMYGRTFTPLFSIFLQLQNTTAAMGATKICPGLQMTLSWDVGACQELCGEEGYPLVDPATGYWAAGDAVLMNMNSYHLGPAHTDPTPGSERVMVVLTFGPRPRPRAESRQVSQGATMSMRHDHWGHTLQDVQHAETVMKQPFNTLRAYGLYHMQPPQASSSQQQQGLNWGYDYITNIYMRIANDPSSFDADDLVELKTEQETFFTWLPTFLKPTLFDDEADHDNAWYYFLKALLQRVYTLHVQVVCLAVLAYLILYTLEGWLLKNNETTLIKKKNQKSTINIPIPLQDDASALPPVPVGGLKFALIRLVRLALLAYGGLAWARHLTDSTQWAQDLQQGRLFHSVTQHENKFADIPQKGYTTFPTKYDVLLEHRLGGSHYLGMIKDFIDKGHYGNLRFEQVVSSFANPLKNKNHVGSSVVEFAKDVVIRSIWDTLRFPSEESEGAARFLEQGIKGKWYLTSQEKAYTVIEKALLGQVQFPILGILSRETLLPMITEWRYGIYQSTAWASKHGVPVLQALERQLYQQAAVAAAATAAAAGTTTTTNQTLGPRTRSLGRPVPVRTAVSIDGSTLIVTPSPSLLLLTSTITRGSTASTASSGTSCGPRLSVLPQIPRLSAPRGIGIPRCRLSMSARSSSASQLRTPPRSLVLTPPSSGDWLHSESWVYIKERRDDLWYPGRVIDVLPNQRTRIQTMHGKTWHNINSVRPLNSSEILGQDVELRLSKSRFVECRVIRVHDNMYDNKRPKSSINNNNKDHNPQVQTKPVPHTVSLDLEFEDGTVMEGVDILLVRREQLFDGEEEDDEEDEDEEEYSSNKPKSPYSVSEDE